MTDQIRPGGQGEDKLEGRVAIVTGGSSGIGAATARRLAAAGAKVVVGFNAGRNRAEALITELAGEGHLAARIPMEDSAAIASVANAVRETLGRADVLINSAGITRAVPHADLAGLDDATMESRCEISSGGRAVSTHARRGLLVASGEAHPKFAAPAASYHVVTVI